VLHFALDSHTIYQSLLLHLWFKLMYAVLPKMVLSALLKLWCCHNVSLLVIERWVRGHAENSNRRSQQLLRSLYLFLTLRCFENEIWPRWNFALTTIVQSFPDNSIPFLDIESTSHQVIEAIYL